MFAPSGLVAGNPQGAFYGLLKITNPQMTALDFAKSLLLQQGVAVVPGDTFGASTARMVRIAFTIEDSVLAEGLRRIRDRLHSNWT
jgi:aspartate/methionine/tyrosine aminotransferase